MLAFDGLTGGYGAADVVFEVSGEVAAGQVLGVFGRNGVGKTTLARLLQGSLPVRRGTIRLGGQRIETLRPCRPRQLGLGYMPQTGMVFDDLTVRENLSLIRAATDPATFFELFPRLGERLDQKAGRMSGGERKILSFVRTISEDSTLLVFDEPSEGVQPENILRMEWCLKQRRAEGAAIVLIEQNLSMLTAVADSYLGLDTGRVVLRGARDAIGDDDLRGVLSI